MKGKRGAFLSRPHGITKKGYQAAWVRKPKKKDVQETYTRSGCKLEVSRVYREAKPG